MGDSIGRGSDGGLECRDVRLVRQTPEGQERIILDGVFARFPAGSASLIVGAIGAGKSTLLHILAALLRPTSGEVLAGGEAISRYASAHRDRWRRQVGLAFQTPHVLPELTVAENVMVPLVPRSPTLSQARAHALEELERMGVAHLAERRVGSLSGGERQRLILARALVGRPEYLLVDEPTAHQDSDGARLILERLGAERQRGATVVIITHDGALLREAGLDDAVWRLAGGRLEAEP